MQRREFVSRLVRQGLVGGTVTGLAGCGTLFYKERLGQPHSNRIDWCVAAADGLGLLLFFIPGIIAFVVDFHTGAIYLPCDQTALNGVRPDMPPGEPGMIPATGTVATSDGVELARIDRPREQLDPRSLETVVSAHVGRPVEIVDSEARVSKLVQLDQFASQRRMHGVNRGFGMALKGLLTGNREAV
jgi:hypothetical protein